MKKMNWHGVDASNEESLFRYGFLMRWRSKHQDYQVVHHCGFDGKGGMLFMYSSFDYADELKDLKGDRLRDLSKMCGMSEEEYMKCISPVNLANDMLAYYGIDDTFGACYGVSYTEKQIRRKLGKALRS